MKKTPWIIAGVVIILVAIVGFFIWNTSRHPSLVTGDASSTTVGATSTVDASSSSLAENGCLPNDEYAEVAKNDLLGLGLNSSTIDINLRNKLNGRILSTFQLQNVDYPNVHPIEFGSCSLYVMEGFGGYIGQPGYEVQLWKYDYTGQGKKLLEMFKIAGGGNEEVYYSQIFRTDPSEKYLALIQGNASSVVIEDIQTLQTIFSLSIPSIFNDNPKVAGDVDFSPGGWSGDGRYFWFDISQGADITGLIEVDTKHLSYRTFLAPVEMRGGDAFNPDTGMTTYETNVAPWTADAQSDAYYREQAAQSGQVSSFNIENLLTGQVYVVATTTDPTYYYRPQWLSDSVLEYTLPSGATSTYTVR